MSLLFPRSSAHHPTRHELGPFYSLWNDTFNELQRLSDNLPNHSHFVPKFDVKESKEAYTLQGELPGIDQKNITIEFNDEKTLVIHGQTEYHREDGHPSSPAAAPRRVTVEDETEAGSPTAAESSQAQTTQAVTKPSQQQQNGSQSQVTYWVSERSVGSFQRSFTFPQAVSHEAKASLKNGILTVVVPKILKPATPRRVQIE